MKVAGKWVLVLTIAFGLMLPSWFMSTQVEARGSGGHHGLIIFENVPQSDVSVEGNSIQLSALNVHEDGHFTKVEKGVRWKSKNPRVAKVEKDGTVTFTGKPGRTWIVASNGRSYDRIAAAYKPSRSKEGKHDFQPIIQKQRGERYQVVEHALANMTMEEKVGQMLMPDFRTWEGENVTDMLPEIKEMVQKYHLGGVILFRENVVTTEQTIKLVSDYQDASEKYGLLMTIDQEGGIVTRLQSGTDMPGNMALGAARSEELAQDAGAVNGAELASLGINMNFAPVMDVNNNPDNPVIGVRSFGEDPLLVGKLGTAYTKGVQQQGVAATAKHFPGHGDTATDSHIGLPEVPYDLERLEEVELLPFQQAMDAGIDAVMTAHITFPKIDATKVTSKKDGSEIALPATLSEKVLTGLMREEMDYNGVVVTDALNMKAIADHFGPVDAVIRAINAGTDIALMPVGLQEVVPGVYEAVESGRIPIETVDDSVKRILSLKVKRGILKEETPQPLENKIQEAAKIVGSEEHQIIEKEASERSVTLVKNEGVLPLTPSEEEHLVFIGNTFVNALGDAVSSRHSNTEVLQLDGSGWTEEQSRALSEADYVIVGTYTYNVSTRSEDHPQMQIVQDVMTKTDVPVIGVGIRNPYDIMAYPEIDAYLAQYGFREASFKATADTLFGVNHPTGQLPVTIPDGDGGVLFEYGTGLTYRE